MQLSASIFKAYDIRGVVPSTLDPQVAEALGRAFGAAARAAGEKAVAVGRDGRLSGLIDFYFACTDMLAYDLSICLNAWCFEPDGAFNVTKARALLSGYRAERPLSPAEVAALPVLARGNALRFLLTRLYDWLNHPPGAFVRPKDPLEYWRKLRFHQQVTSVAAYGIDP